MRFPENIECIRHCRFICKTESDLLCTSLNEGFCPISVCGLKVKLKLSEMKIKQKHADVFVPVWCPNGTLLDTQLQQRMDKEKEGNTANRKRSGKVYLKR